MLWPAMPEENGGLQHTSRLHEAQGKVILDLLKGGPNRAWDQAAEAKAASRHHRSGTLYPSVQVKQGELWLDVSQRHLTDESLMGVLSEKFCKAIHEKASSSKSIAPDVFYLNIDISQNRLTGQSISLLLDFFAQLNNSVRPGGRPFVARILRLYKNHLGDHGALQVARFITTQTAPLHELHLSHSEISQEGAEAILRAFGAHPAGSYPFQLLINKSLFGACWVRLEHNDIRDPAGLLKAVGEVGTRITPTTDRRGGDFGPGRAPDWASTPEVVPHAVLSWQYHQVTAVSHGQHPRESTPQEQQAQQRAQDAAAALNSAFLQGLLNPAHAASEGAAEERIQDTEPPGPSSAAGQRIVGLQAPDGRASTGGRGANKIRGHSEEPSDLEPPTLPPPTTLSNAQPSASRSQKGQIAARVKGALLAAQTAAQPPESDVPVPGPVPGPGPGPGPGSRPVARPPPPPPIQTSALLSTTPPDAPPTPERSQDVLRREPEGLRQAKEVVASLDTCSDGEVMMRWMQHLERSLDPMKEAERIMKMLRSLVRQGFCTSSVDWKVRETPRISTIDATVSSQRSSRTSPREPQGHSPVTPAEIISQLQRLAAQSQTSPAAMMSQRIPPPPLDHLGRPASPAYTSPAGSMSGGILSTVPTGQASPLPLSRGSGPVPVGKISPSGSQSNSRDNGAPDIDMMAILLKELGDPRIASQPAKAPSPSLPPPK